MRLPYRSAAVEMSPRTKGTVEQLKLKKQWDKTCCFFFIIFISFLSIYHLTEYKGGSHDNTLVSFPIYYWGGILDLRHLLYLPP